MSNGESHLLRQYCSLATCHLQHAAANETEAEAAAKLQSNLVCAAEIERTCTLQKKPREQQSQVSRVSQAAGGWQREKHKREVRCREEKEEGRKKMKTGIVYALLDVSHYTRLPSKELKR